VVNLCCVDGGGLMGGSGGRIGKGELRSLSSEEVRKVLLLSC
jgi:hypothetical protein